MMIILISTGFYLTYVFASPKPAGEPVLFLHAEVRMWHLITGFVLIAATIFKTYLFFFDRMSRVERVSVLDFINPMVWIRQIKYYLFMGEHPHTRGAYNPLQFMAYLGLYIMIVLICVTGLILYVHVYHEGMGGFLYEFMRPLEAMMGGLANVRAIHHITMWGIIIFTPIHIYLAVFSSIKGKEGALDAIFSGYKYEKPEKH
jgi:Ni/Fe-hydrogenase 1 B-type cytochrome subunit